MENNQGMSVRFQLYLTQLVPFEWSAMSSNRQQLSHRLGADNDDVKSCHFTLLTQFSYFYIVQLLLQFVLLKARYK